MQGCAEETEERAVTSWEAGDPETVAGVCGTDYVPLKTAESQEQEMAGTKEGVGALVTSCGLQYGPIRETRLGLSLSVLKHV